MSLTLGEKLRQARDERGISISEVAEQTRISPMYLQLIENDDYRTLPGGIFNKGFVKSYAKYVGIDEQEALQDYAKLVSTTDETNEEQKSYRPEVLTDDRNSSSMIPTVIFAVIILGLMTWGILALVNYIQSNQSQAPAVANTNTSTSNSNSNTSTTAPTTSTAPAMAAIKVEFKTSGEDISLNATTDGKKTTPLVKAATPAVFQGMQVLELNYLKLKSSFAQLFIDGKEIKLPEAPESPKDKYISFKIDAQTLPGFWDKGAVTFGGAVVPAADANTNTNTAVTTGPVTPPPAAAAPRTTPNRTVPAPGASPAAAKTPGTEPAPKPTTVVVPSAPKTVTAPPAGRPAAKTTP